MSDLRELLSDIIFDFRNPTRLGTALELADAILDDPRLGIVQLPQPIAPRSHSGLIYFAVDQEFPMVAVPEPRMVRFGHCYWNLAQGDDPEILAAALLAAKREALR